MRVKGGIATHRRHKKVLELAKGYRHGNSKLFALAKQAVLHAGQYAYRDRRVKKRDFRSLWIVKINAGARQNDITYGKLIAGMAKNKIALNRKTLANLAQNEPQAFAEVIKTASK